MLLSSKRVIRGVPCNILCQIVIIALMIYSKSLSAKAIIVRKLLCLGANGNSILLGVKIGLLD
jgi:hypothetical protein